MKKFQVKVFLVMMEIVYILGLMMVLLVSAYQEEWDFMRAFISTMFTVAIVMFHDCQKNYKWEDEK